MCLDNGMLDVLPLSILQCQVSLLQQNYALVTVVECLYYYGNTGELVAGKGGRKIPEPDTELYHKKI